MKRASITDAALIVLAASLALAGLITACTSKAEARPVVYKFVGPAVTANGQPQPAGSIKHYLGKFVAGADTTRVTILAKPAMADTNVTPTFEAPAFVNCYFEVRAVDLLNRAGLPISSDPYSYDPGRPGLVPGIVRVVGTK